jgi:hypothetical protein
MPHLFSGAGQNFKNFLNSLYRHLGVGWPYEFPGRNELELELELILAHMAQKPLLWVEAGAPMVRNKISR